MPKKKKKGKEKNNVMTKANEKGGCMNLNVLPQSKALPQCPNPSKSPLHDNAPSGRIRCLMEKE